MSRRGLGGEGGFGDAEARRRRLREIQSVVGDVAGELRRPVNAPDLTEAILARVEEERPFTTARTRRLVLISRIGLAASIAVAALGIAMVHRAAPELVTWTYQAQPVSDVAQMAESAASTRYRSFRVTLSSVGQLASGGELVRAGQRSEGGSAEMGMAAGGARVEPALAWTMGHEAQLAPLPPAYGATYVSLAFVPGVGTERGGEVGVSGGGGSGGVVISTVQLAPGMMPRPLAAEMQPSAAYWGGRLSTAPSASMAVPVMFEPAELSRLRAARMWAGGSGATDGGRAAGAAVLGIGSQGGAERRVLDSLVPVGAGAGVGSGEWAVPR